MEIGSKDVEQIIVATAAGEVLAVVSDREIVEKTGIRVSLDGA